MPVSTELSHVQSSDDDDDDDDDEEEEETEAEGYVCKSDSSSS